MELKIKKPEGKTSKYQGGLPEKMIAIVNKHIESEAFSSQIYLQMAAWCDVQGYTGAAKFFKKHYFEERTHMLKLYEFLADKNIVAVTPTIEAPKQEYACLCEVVDAALEHEFDVTYSYEVDAQVALMEPCHQTYQLMQYFIKEQVEEESLFQTIVDKKNILTKDGVSGLALMELDDILEEYSE